MQADALPVGRNAVLTHVGDFAQVYTANVALHAWRQQHRRAAVPIDGRASGGAHVESYVSDPSVEPDASGWIAEVAIRLQDSSSTRAATFRPFPGLRDVATLP